MKARGRYQYVFTGTAFLLPRSRGWREAATACRLIAAGRRTDLRDRLIRILDGEPAADPQGPALALACLGGELDGRLLVAHLRKALTPAAEAEGEYWTLAALLHLDARLGTRRAREFLGFDGLWERWVGSAERSLTDLRHEFEQLVLLMNSGSPDSGRRFEEQGPHAPGSSRRHKPTR
ncbi:hypothetical protein SAMN05216223_105489 [Actinacidiphila yanglinensis]|uniref:Uncharacterized protein n=1 Tax=Actinacidiphila yanglinensis TaxID=310779 RepID=A0A1H6ALC9_9ACTN|nr:DUF6000 family protein [Actinacidiphila yanglinensis]SEG49519.1 hypothetical protein SAMN05216223_105489 [Actinacidiphila yanglinensis]